MINGNYAISSGLKPAKDALVLESSENNPYGNFLAVKKGNEKDPRVKKLAKLLTSPEVKKFIEDKYQGSCRAVLLIRPARPAPGNGGAAHGVRSARSGPRGAVRCFHVACWAAQQAMTVSEGYGAAQ